MNDQPTAALTRIAPATGAPIAAQPGQPHTPLAGISQAAHDFATNSKAASTKRSYTAAWQHFAAWCQATGAPPLPATPATVASYIAALADGSHASDTATSAADMFARKPLKVATITRKLAAISQAHQLAGYESPTRTEAVRTVMKGIRRTLGTAQAAKAPATVEVVRLLLEQIPRTGLAGQRDRALLLLGFAGAFRRSELVALEHADLRFERAGLRVTMRRSKTDQEGAGTTKGIPYGLIPATCPVRALEQWLKAAAIKSGPVFRPLTKGGTVKTTQLTGQSVALIVKRYADRAGLDVPAFAGHSLRAGLATSAAAAGVSERKIMQQTGHKSTQMVRKYIRDAELFQENAAGAVGL